MGGGGFERRTATALPPAAPAAAPPAEEEVATGGTLPAECTDATPAEMPPNKQLAGVSVGVATDADIVRAVEECGGGGGGAMIGTGRSGRRKDVEPSALPPPLPPLLVLAAPRPSARGCGLTPPVGGSIRDGGGDPMGEGVVEGRCRCMADALDEDKLDEAEDELDE